MNYASARVSIGNGDLIAFRGRKGPLAPLVRLVTGSPYTHTAVAFWCEGRLLVAETNGANAAVAPLSQHLGTDFDVFACPVKREDAVDAVWDALGVSIGYDFTDLVVVAAHRLLGTPLPPADDDKLFCSALSATIYKHGGWRPAGLPSIPAPDDVVRAVGGVSVIEVR